MKRSLPGLSGLHTRSVLAAASRSLHFSRSANFCPRLPRASCELSRGYTTPKRKRATVRWPFLFSKALCPRPKLLDLVTLAELLAAERSKSLLKKPVTGDIISTYRKGTCVCSNRLPGPFHTAESVCGKKFCVLLGVKGLQKGPAETV